MNRQTIIGIIIGAVAVTAIATYAGYELADREEYAEVIAVEPHYVSQAIPREECRDVISERQKPVKDKHQVTGTVAGAVIGGLIGNQIGDGSGQDIATAAGAVAGGYAGNKAQEKIQENNTEQTVSESCRTAYDQHREQDGYLVTYEWAGERRTVQMDVDPGNRIPVEDGVPQYQ
jgi:uncharacterized protein YcfJ